jgi:hypothetical protein
VQIIEDPGTQRRQVPVRVRIIVIGDTGATFMTRLRNEIEADSTVRDAQNQMILPAILDSVEELTKIMSQTPPPASPADFSSNLGLIMSQTPPPASPADFSSNLGLIMSQTPPPASPADFSSNLGLRVRDGEMEEMYYSPFVLHVWRGQTHMLAPPTYISLEN